MSKFKDLTGRIYGCLKVLRRDSDRIPRNGKPVTMWFCQCECGKTVSVKAYSLTSGHTRSCGCKSVKHGRSHKERLYEVWKNMKRRCIDPSNKRYAHYGAKGVTVCKEWKNDYITFRKWAYANGYEPNLTIDRINNDGNYEPSNCRWATSKEQENNMSRNRLLEYKGNTHTMSEWADILGLSYGAMNHRVQRNWTMERIVNTPQRGTVYACEAVSARMS